MSDFTAVLQQKLAEAIATFWSTRDTQAESQGAKSISGPAFFGLARRAA